MAHVKMKRQPPKRLQPLDIPGLLDDLPKYLGPNWSDLVDDFPDLPVSLLPPPIDVHTPRLVSVHVRCTHTVCWCGDRSLPRRFFVSKGGVTLLILNSPRPLTREDVTAAARFDVNNHSLSVVVKENGVWRVDHTKLVPLPFALFR